MQDLWQRWKSFVVAIDNNKPQKPEKTNDRISKGAGSFLFVDKLWHSIDIGQNSHLLSSGFISVLKLKTIAHEKSHY